MKTLSMLILALALMSCAKAPEAASVPTKDLFSTWQTSTGVPLNLTAAQFDQLAPVTVNFSDGATCSCNVYFSGSNAGGSFGLSQCVYGSGGSGDPGCGSLNTSGTFSNVANVLTICNPSCKTYQ